MSKPNDEAKVYEILPDKREKYISLLCADVAIGSGYLNKDNYVLRCPDCGAKMHFCRGPHRFHFAATKINCHTEECERNHHKSDEQLSNEKTKRKQERELRKEIEPGNSLSAIMTSARRHDDRLYKKETFKGLENEVVDETPERVKTPRDVDVLYDGIYVSEKDPTRLVHNYFQSRVYYSLDDEVQGENGRHFSDVMFVKDTKQAFRNESGMFGKRVLVLASLIPKILEQKMKMDLEKNEVFSLLNPDNLEYRLLEDSFTTSFLCFNDDGTVKTKDWEKVVFCLLFKNPKEEKLFDEHFSSPGDFGSSRKKTNKNVRLAHVVLAEWGKDYNYIDMDGHSRRIVSGFIFDFERQVNTLSDDIFETFENERIVSGDQDIFI